MQLSFIIRLHYMSTLVNNSIRREVIFMKQLNLPTKPINAARVWVSLALAVVILVLSICPIISVDLKDNKVSEGLQKAIDGLNESNKGELNIEVPESVSVTMPKLVRVDIFIARSIGTLLKSLKNNKETGEEDLEKIREMLKDPKYQEAFVMVVAMTVDIVDFDKIFDNKTGSGSGEISNTTTTVTGDGSESETGGENETGNEAESGSETGKVNENGGSAADEAKSEGSAVGTIIMIVVRVIVLLIILSMIMFLPIVVCVKVIIGLISALSNLDYPEKVSAKIGAIPMTGLDFAICIALMLTLFSGLGFGYGLKWIFVCSIVGSVINLVATRLRSYEAKDFCFVNIIQSSCTFALIAGVVYTLSTLKVGVIKGFFDAFGSYMEKLTVNVTAVNSAIKGFNEITDGKKIAEVGIGYDWLIDAGIIMLFAVFAVCSCAALILGATNRLCLTQKKNDRGLIYNGIVAAITAALPFVADYLQNAKEYDFEITGDTANVITTSSHIYQLPDSSKSALIAMIVCGILVMAVGIVINVLKRKFCPEMSVEYQRLILGGNAPEIRSKEDNQSDMAASDSKNGSGNTAAPRR